MPTGYTYDVQTGKVTEFKQFAMNCARAFGALIMMRDDPPDAPIPEEFKPSTEYHDKAIASARALLVELPQMTPNQIGARCREEYDAEVKKWQLRKENRETEKERYQAMLGAAETWIPPSPDHLKFKEFMIEQLTGSIDFDCNPTYDTYPKFQHADDWLAAQIKEARRNIDYHEAEIVKEVNRTSERNAWVRKLRESL